MQRFWETVFDTLTGAAIKGAEVWVYDAATNGAVTIYSAADGSGNAGNPLISDSNGFVEGYLPDGLYNVEFRFGGVSMRLITNVAMFDLADMRADLDGVIAADALKASKVYVDFQDGVLANAISALDADTYAKAETYTKAEVNAAITAAIGGVGAGWGAITGDIATQADLQTALGLKMAKASNLSDLGNLATSRNNLSVYSKAQVDAAIAAVVTTGALPETTFTKPTTATFTSLRPATGTIENSTWGVRIRAPGTVANSNNIHYAVHALTVGAGGWRVTGRFRFAHAYIQWSCAGIVCRNSGTNGAVLFSRLFDGTDGFSKNVYTSDTAWSSVAGMAECKGVIDYWLRVTDDKTNRIVEFSLDGERFYRCFSEATNTNVTPNQVGIFLNPNCGSAFGTSFIRTEIGMECLSWLAEAL